MSRVIFETNPEIPRTYRKPFPCHLCGFTDYSEKQALVEHLKNYHNFEKDEIATNVVDFLITKFNFGNEDVEMPPPWNRNFQEIPSLEEPTDDVILADERPAIGIQNYSFNVNDSDLFKEIFTKSIEVNLGDFIKNLPFSEGDLVIAKWGRSPYWPGVILKCHKTDSFFRYREPNFGVNGEVLEFNVNFFGAKTMSTAWLPKKKILKEEYVDVVPGDPKKLKEAIGWAKYLSHLTNEERVEYFNGDLKSA